MPFKTGTWGEQAKERAKKRAAYFLKYNQNRDQLKIKARRILNVALIKNKIKRLPCKVCGIKKVEAHHRDYSKPLEVIWLCHFHHREVHKKVELR